jgi:hypothetical protein
MKEENSLSSRSKAGGIVSSMLPVNASECIMSSYKQFNQDNYTKNSFISSSTFSSLLSSAFSSIAAIPGLTTSTDKDFFNSTLQVQNDSECIILLYDIYLPQNEDNNAGDIVYIASSISYLLKGEKGTIDIKYKSTRDVDIYLKFVVVSIDPEIMHSIKPGDITSVKNENLPDFNIHILLSESVADKIIMQDVTNNNINTKVKQSDLLYDNMISSLNFALFSGFEGSFAPSFGVAMNTSYSAQNLGETQGTVLLFTPQKERFNQDYYNMKSNNNISDEAKLVKARHALRSLYAIFSDDYANTRILTPVEIASILSAAMGMVSALNSSRQGKHKNIINYNLIINNQTNSFISMYRVNNNTSNEAVCPIIKPNQLVSVPYSKSTTLNDQLNFKLLVSSDIYKEFSEIEFEINNYGKGNKLGVSNIMLNRNQESGESFENKLKGNNNIETQFYEHRDEKQNYKFLIMMTEQSFVEKGTIKLDILSVKNNM